MQERVSKPAPAATVALRPDRGVRLDLSDVDHWVRAHVEPVEAIEVVHERPWATVLRVPLRDRVVWVKACAPVQDFEPRLTAELGARWPDRVAEVLACDEQPGNNWSGGGSSTTGVPMVWVWLVASPSPQSSMPSASKWFAIACCTHVAILSPFEPRLLEADQLHPRRLPSKVTTTSP
jgi:hypothetical protein